MVDIVWTGPVECCDICGSILGGSQKEFVDGKMQGSPFGRGAWAVMCIPCFEEMGTGLGQGKGQRYRLEDRQGVRAWYKIEG